jgi:putative cell wall-binding protein
MVARRPVFAVVVTLLVLAVVASPGVALAAGTIGGTVSDGNPSYNPVPGVSVGLFEYSFPTGWTLVDTDVSDGAGKFSVYAPDGTECMLRAGGAGWQTWDAMSTFAIPPTTSHNVHLDEDTVLVERVWDDDRYSTAVNVARTRFTSPTNPTLWLGVDTIVIASGEDRAAADPLAAAGLCGVYNAPLFLVTQSAVPNEVKQAVKEILATRQGTRVVIVGGPASVPDAIFDQLNALSSTVPLTKDRIIGTGDRYDLAAAIAQRMKLEKGDPDYALIANGADSSKFFDALALSPIAARKEYPILLVKETSVPSATKNTLASIGNPHVVIGGGPATVSDGVKAQLAAVQPNTDRWWGADRYKTAIDIADKATLKNWLDEAYVGVAAKLPDALTGGATIGQVRGVLLITDGTELTSSTGDWLSSRKATVDKCFMLGGPHSVSQDVKTQIYANLQ